MCCRSNNSPSGSPLRGTEKFKPDRTTQRFLVTREDASDNSAPPLKLAFADKCRLMTGKMKLPEILTPQLQRPVGEPELEDGSVEGDSRLISPTENYGDTFVTPKTETTEPPVQEKEKEVEMIEGSKFPEIRLKQPRNKPGNTNISMAHKVLVAKATKDGIGTKLKLLKERLIELDLTALNPLKKRNPEMTAREQQMYTTTNTLKKYAVPISHEKVRPGNISPGSRRINIKNRIILKSGYAHLV